MQYGAVGDTFYFNFVVIDSDGNGKQLPTVSWALRKCGRPITDAAIMTGVSTLYSLSHSDYNDGKGCCEIAIDSTTLNDGSTYALFAWSVLTDSTTPAAMVGQLTLNPILATGDNVGSGARTCVLTVDDGTDPIPGARIRLTKGGQSYIGETDGDGEATFNIDDGTWTVAITAPGYDFTGTTLVVDGDETATYSMDSIAVAASDPGLITATSTVKAAGVGVVGTIITYYVSSVSTEVTGLIIASNTDQTATSTTGGAIQFVNVQPGATYRWSTTGGSSGEFSIPIDATNGYAIPAFMV